MAIDLLKFNYSEFSGHSHAMLRNFYHPVLRLCGNVLATWKLQLQFE
jgi:hypothetical protein